MMPSACLSAVALRSLTSDIAQRFGFSAHYANKLAYADDLLWLCRRADNRLGAKLRILQDYCQKYEIGIDEVMSMGDGANDIPMLDSRSWDCMASQTTCQESIAIQLNIAPYAARYSCKGCSESSH